jgi:selenocysteine lyase/cysteine desulfurase
LFEVTKRYAYLNHASVGGLPRPVVEAMTHYLHSRAASGSEALVDWEAHIIERVRQQVAGFLGAHRDEIAFTGSVSHGLNIVAAGLDWQPGDNVVCAETEFPANVYPWTNLRRRGVEVRLVPARDNRILTKDVKDAVDTRTRLVAISFVEFASGYRNDLDALAGICHARGAYLCVDGIQGLGALHFSVRETPVDVMAGHAAKWMLGPIGAGFLYVRRELLDTLDPVMAGWRSVVDREAYFSYDSPLRETADRFEPGSPNVAGLVGLGTAVELLLDVGQDTIEARIFELTDYLIDRLRAQGCAIVSPVTHRGERSGIVSFRPPAIDLPTFAERLHAAGVIVSMRGDAIRVSPHFYNTIEDLERLLQHSRVDGA